MSNTCRVALLGFSEFERATLGNGLKVVVAERQSVPQVNVTLLVDSGYVRDLAHMYGIPIGELPGPVL